MSLHDLIPADLRPEVVARLTAGETAYLNVACVCVPYWAVGHPDHLCACLPAWVELAEAICQTCFTMGVVRATGDLIYDEVKQELIPTDDWTTKPCLDCRQGKPIHTISVPCSNCEGIGGVLEDSMILYGIPGGEDWTRCTAGCDPNGAVEVKAIVREVLPVYDKIHADWRTHDHVYAGLTTHAYIGGKRNRITVIGPEPTPGDHIAIIEPVQS